MMERQEEGLWMKGLNLRIVSLDRQVGYLLDAMREAQGFAEKQVKINAALVARLGVLAAKLEHSD